ncbi:MAG: acylphosphatase [Pseudomonadota bacterium]
MATRFLIEGHVQGVGYRDWCRREAQRRGLKGYVCNLPDGRVEAVFIGENSAIDAMLIACRKGPSYARVDAVGLDPVDAPDLDDFVILPDR